MSNKLELTGWEYMRTLYKDIRKIETSKDFVRHCAQYGAALHSCTDNDDLNDAVVLFEDRYLHLYDGDEENWWQLFLDTKLSDYVGE